MIALFIEQGFEERDTRVWIRVRIDTRRKQEPKESANLLPRSGSLEASRGASDDPD